MDKNLADAQKVREGKEDAHVLGEALSWAHTIVEQNSRSKSEIKYLKVLIRFVEGDY